MSDPGSSHRAELPPWPQVDFAAFGEVEVRPLSRIHQIAAGFLARNWALIPHVTHHDDADVTELEALRKELGTRHPDIKLTPLPFLIKAVVAALRQCPEVNASLDPSGKSLVLKKYFHVGVAVDTPAGLLVPVIRDCDQKNVTELAREIAAISAKARTKGLAMAEMSGGCFTISSLGGVGGTAFTPIINAPELAILGVTNMIWKPRRGEGDRIDWRLMLPLSLSYDHRVINGVQAARFTRCVAEALGEPQRLIE